MAMHSDYALGLIFVLPFVVAFFYVYFRINDPWLFWRPPAPHRPL